MKFSDKDITINLRMRFIMFCGMSLASSFEIGMNTGRLYGGFACFGKQQALEPLFTQSKNNEIIQAWD